MYQPFRFRVLLINFLATPKQYFKPYPNDSLSKKKKTTKINFICHFYFSFLTWFIFILVNASGIKVDNKLY